MMRAMLSLALRTSDDLDRETLRETALEAAGGGSVIALAQVPGDPEVWRASVVGRDGIVRDIRLDLRLRTVAVAELRSVRAAA
jgi:hypothetical protein